MIITEKEISTNFPEIFIGDNISTAFFDIETTGFISDNTHLYALGVAYNHNQAVFYRQWFIEDESEEKGALIQFLEFINNIKRIVHFNGTTFDVPYVVKKCEKYNLKCDLKEKINIDIYKLLLSKKKYLKFEGFKQKNIEDSLNIKRNDTYDGKELIKIYHAYQSMKNLHDAQADIEADKLFQILFLHNYEDVANLVCISHILDFKIPNNDNNYHIISKSNELVISIDYNYDSIIRNYISCFRYNDLFFNIAFEYCSENKMIITLPTFEKELKYYIPDYKNYYYLPLEDYAIHKSIGQYVDPKFRTKAKKDNCYVKKTGKFIPLSTFEKNTSIKWLSDNNIEYFKDNYTDNIVYISLDTATNNTKKLLEIIEYYMKVK